MEDMFGVNLEIGDKVIYTNSGQGSTSLKIGTIMSVCSEGYPEVKSDDTGRMQNNSKRLREIAAVSPFKKVHPECFI